MSLFAVPELRVLRRLSRDGRTVIATRVVRLFAYGWLAVVLALYLAALGLSEPQIGLVLSLTLVGDAVLALWVASVADWLGRRRMLLASAGLMVGAGLVFSVTENLLVLIAAAVVGTVSPSGAEVGPAGAIEQAALPHAVPDADRTAVFAWYNLAGSFATALGALAGGLVAQALQENGWAPLASYRVVLLGYAVLGLAQLLMALRLSPAIEAPAFRQKQLPVQRPLLGLERSRAIVVRLAGLFALDAFAGGLIVQSLMAYWFSVRFGTDPAQLGAIFFGANLFAGLSALAAARIAARVGLLNTMVWTHLPSNVLLMLIPLMPTLPLAIAVLLARSSISQMDVPTRQSYLAAVVDPNERSAAAGVTTTARTAASAAAPLVSGALLGLGLLAAPFLLAGGLKIVYDLALLRAFRTVKPPEEQATRAMKEGAVCQQMVARGSGNGQFKE